MKYFSYGSNMASARMASRVGRPVSFKRAVLRGYRRVFNKPMWEDPAHGYANIVPASGESVSGVLFDCTEADFLALDVYEGVADGHYERRDIVVECEGRAAKAIVYVACVPEDAPSIPSTPEYVGMVLQGAEQHSFEAEEIDAIFAASRVSRSAIPAVSPHDAVTSVGDV